MLPGFTVMLWDLDPRWYTVMFAMFTASGEIMREPFVAGPDLTESLTRLSVGQALKSPDAALTLHASVKTNCAPMLCWG